MTNTEKPHPPEKERGMRTAFKLFPMPRCFGLTLSGGTHAYFIRTIVPFFPLLVNRFFALCGQINVLKRRVCLAFSRLCIRVKVEKRRQSDGSFSLIRRVISNLDLHRFADALSFQVNSVKMPYKNSKTPKTTATQQTASKRSSESGLLS